MAARSLAAVFLMAGLLPTFRASADLDCSQLSGSTRDKCEELEKKASTYQSIIRLKSKQQSILSSQLKSIDQEQQQTLSGMQDVQKNIDDLQRRIDSLNDDIMRKEKEIEGRKRILSGLMQSYYELDQQGILKIMLAGESLSEALFDSEGIEESGVKVSDILGEMTRARRELMSSKEEIMQTKSEHDRNKLGLIEKQNNLQDSESQKQDLLSQTQGEEARYQDLLQRVEAQKNDLFDFGSAGNLAEVEGSVNDYPKPSGNLASTSWYFSQKDPRWGDSRIGNSQSLMRNYGCAVAAISMVFRKYGASIDPGRMAKQQIFSFDLINWPTAWNPGIALESSVTHGNVNWSTINSAIAKGDPAIVYIKKTGESGGGHYVVITGRDSRDYIVHDPYFGPNLYLGTSRALVGKIGTDSGTAVDQMIVYGN